MTITQTQLINLFSQPINPNTYLTFSDLLLNQNPPQKGEEVEEVLQNLFTYFQSQKSILLISGETGEIVNEIPIQNYNNQKFGIISNTNYIISINY